MGNQDSIEALRDRLRRFAQERDWAQFHSPRNLAAALAVESGELLEHFQWLSNEQSDDLDSNKRAAVATELADVFIYAVQLADRLGVDLLEAAGRKIELNAAKYPVEKAKGKITKYTDI